MPQMMLALWITPCSSCTLAWDWIYSRIRTTYAQPDTTAAKKTILTRTHPGEIALLHSTSATNAAVLGEVIDTWRADGYEIHSIQELVSADAS